MTNEKPQRKTALRGLVFIGVTLAAIVYAFVSK